jgi:hypothetical protein
MSNWNDLYRDTLAEADLHVGNPRGVRGGPARDGCPVATTWTDQQLPTGLWPIWAGEIDFGGYLSLWRSGAFHVGALVRLMTLECKPAALNCHVRAIARSKVMPTLYRVAVVVPASVPPTWHLAELQLTSISSTPVRQTSRAA